jgi:hypothetical protein
MDPGGRHGRSGRAGRRGREHAVRRSQIQRLGDRRRRQLDGFFEYGHQSQSIGGYVEPLSQRNPFEAHVGGGGDYMDVGKLSARFTHTATQGWEYGAGLTAARAFKDVQILPVAIPGFGFVPANRFGQLTWLEYGAHVGYSFTPRSTLFVFVTGLVGLDGVGGSGHAGVDYRMTF